MGYRGKVAEQERARELRGRAWTLVEIADELGVRRARHPMGCATVRYGCSRTHRGVMGLVQALLS